MQIENHPKSKQHFLIRNASASIIAAAQEQMKVYGVHGLIEKNGNVTLHNQVRTKFAGLVAVMPIGLTRQELGQWVTENIGGKYAFEFEQMPPRRYTSEFAGKYFVDIKDQI